MNEMPDYFTAVRRLVEDITGLKPKGAEWNADRVRLTLDGQCAGLVQRRWLEVHKLCAECGCSAHFQWEEGLINTVVLDTDSAAPLITTEQRDRAYLTLHPARKKGQVDEQSAA